jgi:hypothetical protein
MSSVKTNAVPGAAEPVPDFASLRDRYRRLNRAFESSYAFRFGRGGGFCAEMLGLVRSMMCCLHRRTRLCTSTGGRPLGVGIAKGYTDYFEPLFPEIDAGVLNALNLRSVRGSGRFPLLRRGGRGLWRAATGAQHFMMDDIGPLPSRLIVPELSIDAGYWDACALLTRLAWGYRADVATDVEDTVSQWRIPASYLSVHLRRGDKTVESPYVSVTTYAAALVAARPEGGVVVVASDDGSAIRELAALVASQFQIIPCSPVDDRGYRRDEFNRLPPGERFHRVKRFLAELEVLRGGDVFIGSAGSNVTYLIEMMRAGEGVVQVR